MRFGKIDTQYGVGFSDTSLLTTANIPYSNASHPDLNTMKGALDWLLQPNDMPLVFSLDPIPPQELGSVLPSVNLTWQLQGTPDSLSVNGVILAPNLNSYQLTGPFSSSINIILTATKNQQAVSSTSQLTFNNRLYWGTLGVDSLDSLSLPNLSSEVVNKRQAIKTISSSNGGFIYIAWPSRLGEGQIKVNGMLSTAWEVSEEVLTNHLGYAEPYIVYRSIYRQHGDLIIVEVL